MNDTGDKSWKLLCIKVAEGNRRDRIG